MRAPFVTLLILLLVNIAVDIYIYFQSRRRCHRRVWSRLQSVTAVLLAALMIVEMCIPAREGGDSQLLGKMWILFGYLSVYIPKYIAVIFDLIASLPLLWKRKRFKPLTKTGIALSIVLFGGLWWGALINRFRIQVTDIEVPVANLPESFSNLRIVQFSDLHTGTFNTDTTYVSKLVDRINSLNPDVIVFTGDIVNRRSNEMLPFVKPLSRLHAPSGVYAILGNHDYGDYSEWPSEMAKRANMDVLFDAYRHTGMQLLLNETVQLRRGNDSIALIGVENIGDPPFKTYGSLRTAYPKINDCTTKILLTHNPQHWVDSIAGDPQANIALTLSGHTHAMQIEIARLSPAAFRYETWGGLYTSTDNRRRLYVNIGSGTVGIPMRLGATPEITVLTLKRAD